LRRHPLAVFLFFSLATVFALDRGLSFIYRRGQGSGEDNWNARQNEYSAALASPGVDVLIVGDSTFAWLPGAIPGRRTFNLARAGFDPSRLRDLAAFLTTRPRVPPVVVISMIPERMATDAWSCPWNVPGRTAWREAALSFYREPNSLKPLLLSASGAVYRFVDRHTVLPENVGNVFRGGARKGDASAANLRLRAANFEMLAEFKKSVEAAGARLIWVRLPYRPDYENALRESADARAIEASLREMFGPDFVALPAAYPAEDYGDEVHLSTGDAASLFGALRQHLDPPR
jgi:hypothetical protein